MSYQDLDPRQRGLEAALNERGIQDVTYELQCQGLLPWSEKLMPGRIHLLQAEPLNPNTAEILQEVGLSSLPLMVVTSSGQQVGSYSISEHPMSVNKLILWTGGLYRKPVTLPRPVKGDPEAGASLDLNRLAEEEREVFGSETNRKRFLEVGDSVVPRGKGFLLLATTGAGDPFVNDIFILRESLKSVQERVEEDIRGQTAESFASEPASTVAKDKLSIAASEYQPVPNSEEEKLLKLLKANSAKAFLKMHDKAVELPDLVTKRDTVWTKLARFGSAGTPAKVQLSWNRLAIILGDVNTEELIRRSSTGELHFSKLDQCLNKRGSEENLMLEMDGSLGGSYPIRARLVKLDVATWKYTDAISYLRGLINAETRLDRNFSEQTLRTRLQNRLGTTEALAYVFSQLQADERSDSIKGVTREGYLNNYGPKARRYPNW